MLSKLKQIQSILEPICPTEDGYNILELTEEYEPRYIFTISGAVEQIRNRLLKEVRKSIGDKEGLTQRKYCKEILDNCLDTGESFKGRYYIKVDANFRTVGF